jgi:uncharacterized protein YndB with AHSA1/START domain
MASDTDRIEKKVFLRSPRARVWRALTDFQQFGSWFGMHFAGPFVPGQSVRGTIVPTTVDATVAAGQKPYEGIEFELHIDRLEPERIFCFRWHPYAVEGSVDYSVEPMTLVQFELEEVAQGVVLTVVESGFDKIPVTRRAKAFDANSGGWSMQVQLIEKYLAQTA